MDICVCITDLLCCKPEANTFLFSLFFFFFFFFWAAPVAYGSSHARGQFGATVAGLHHSHTATQDQAVSVTYTAATQQRRIGPTSVTYTTAYCNAGSLTH